MTEQYVDLEEGLVVLDLGGSTSLTLWEYEKPSEVAPSASNGAVFPIFSVADANVIRTELQARGVDVGELIENGSVSFFTFKDLDGNLLEACQVH